MYFFSFSLFFQGFVLFLTIYNNFISLYNILALFQFLVKRRQPEDSNSSTLTVPAKFFSKLYASSNLLDFMAMCRIFQQQMHTCQFAQYSPHTYHFLLHSMQICTRLLDEVPFYLWTSMLFDDVYYSNQKRLSLTLEVGPFPLLNQYRWLIPLYICSVPSIEFMEFYRWEVEIQYRTKVFELDAEPPSESRGASDAGSAARNVVAIFTPISVSCALLLSNPSFRLP